MPLFDTYDDVLEAVAETNASQRVCNRTPAGQPIVDVKTGGDAEPTVLVTAGAHATEQAGVSAAVELIDRLDTDLELHVIPSRDPIGLNGYPFALGTVLDREVDLETFDDLEALLAEEGSVVYRDGDLLLSLVGDMGFASKRPPSEAESSQLSLLRTLKRLQHERPDVLEPFRGRRIILPAGQPDVPGSGTFERAYTLVVAPDGRVLHLNRFFDTLWAPIEVECTREVMADVEPALSFDLHETQLIEDRFYVEVNQHDEDGWERELGQAIRSATREAGAEFATDADVARVQNITVADPDETPSKRPGDLETIESGCYLRPEPSAGSEGRNALHHAARGYGPSIGTETGMWGDFADRVELLVTVVEAGIAALEDR